MIRQALAHAIHSPTLRSAAAMAAGGVGFGIANLLLARVLPTTEFGVVSLLLSFIQVGAAVGAPGLPVLINRYRLGPTAALLQVSIAASILTALITLLALAVFYRIHLALAAITALAIGCAAMGRVSAAFFQAREQFGLSLLLIQIHNWVLLVSVPLVLLVDPPRADTVLWIVLFGYVATAWVGWRRSSREQQTAAVAPPARGWLHEAASAASYTIAFNVMLQLDRLLIGGTLSMHDLATYSVVAAVAGSAFRMLQTGAGHSLVPRLRRCATRARAWRLLAGELVVLLGMGVLAAMAVLIVMPWLVDHFLAGRYAVTQGMVIAVILVGFVRIVSACAAATVSALGSSRALAQLSAISWLEVLAACACSLWASQFGLVGMIYGLGAGWALGATGASLLAAHTLWQLPHGLPNFAESARPG